MSERRDASGDASGEPKISVSLLFVGAAALLWCLVIGEFSLGELLLGLLFGGVFVMLTGAGRGERAPDRAIGPPGGPPAIGEASARRPPAVVPVKELPSRLFYLAVYVLVLIPYSIVQSNLDMARRLLYPKPDVLPGIVRVELGPVSEATAALVAHALTMTPGETVIDYSDDGETLYVHLVDVAEAAEREASFWRLYHRVLEQVFS